ncbi:MAG: XTP/dITP diphosphatase [Nitrospiraceae bacterium]|nr:XTP/dITP diphosphatase [Nitrospiraceae bacterium]
MDIVLATRNRKKLEEILRIISDKNISFHTLNDFSDFPEVIEDGKTFEENAIKKAVQTAHFTNKPVVADDSGLEVFALSRAPGIFSARYAGTGSNDKENVDKLLQEMRNFKGEKRKARFVCSAAFAFPDGSFKTFEGFVNGIIIEKPRGRNGFGYDPVFVPEGFDRTFAEMTASEKDYISHRKMAIDKLREYLESILSL